MLMCWDHNKSDLRFATRACGSFPLGSGACKSSWTVVLQPLFLHISVWHIPKRERASDMMGDRIWCTGGGTEQADWLQNLQILNVKHRQGAWFVDVCILHSLHQSLTDIFYVIFYDIFYVTESINVHYLVWAEVCSKHSCLEIIASFVAPLCFTLFPGSLMMLPHESFRCYTMEKMI